MYQLPSFLVPFCLTRHIRRCVVGAEQSMSKAHTDKRAEESRTTCYAYAVLCRNVLGELFVLHLDNSLFGVWLRVSLCVLCAMVVSVLDITLGAKKIDSLFVVCVCV